MSTTLSRVSFSRLNEARRNAQKRLQPYRDIRTQAVSHFAGRNYAQNRSVDRTPVNAMELLVNIQRRELASRRPNVRVTTPYPMLRPVADDLSLATNYLLDYMKFGDALQWTVLDAFFGPGIMKVAVCGDSGVGKRFKMHGVPYAEPVDLDDWVHDPRARKFENCTYSGNRYIATRSQLLAEGTWDDDEIDKLAPYRGDWSDESGVRRASTVGGSADPYQEDVEDYYEFWDIWVPGEGRIYTFQEEGQEIERRVDWDGPERGPYHMLGFGRVPGNIMPLAPAITMLDLHRAINDLYRKAIRQANRQKTLTAYQAGTEEDAARIRDAADGTGVRVDNPDKIREINFGGANQVTLAMAIHLVDRFSYQAGNLESIGGLGIGAPTATQDQMLTASANKRISDMQDELLAFVQPVVEDIAWYLWSDEDVQLPLVKRSGQYEAPFTFNKQRRSGEYFHYNFSIEPHSMRRRSPMEEAALLDDSVMKMAPFMPVAMQQGITFDMIEYIKQKAELMNQPGLLQVFKHVGQQDKMPINTDGAQIEAPRVPRIAGSGSGSEATSRGKNRDLVSTLLGKKLQGSEMAKAI